MPDKFYLVGQSRHQAELFSLHSRRVIWQFKKYGRQKPTVDFQYSFDAMRETFQT